MPWGRLEPTPCHRLGLNSAGERTLWRCVPRTLRDLFLRSIFMMRPVVAICICCGSGVNRSAASAETAIVEKTAIIKVRFMTWNYNPVRMSRRLAQHGLTIVYEASYKQF